MSINCLKSDSWTPYLRSIPAKSRVSHKLRLMFIDFISHLHDNSIIIIIIVIVFIKVLGIPKRCKVLSVTAISELGYCCLSD